eukprot:6358725-Prymnesium_polylepis.1
MVKRPLFMKSRKSRKDDEPSSASFDMAHMMGSRGSLAGMERATAASEEAAKPTAAEQEALAAKRAKLK